MKIKVERTLDAIAVFAILTILGLAMFSNSVSAQSYSYNEKDAKHGITKLSENSNSDDSDENETESDKENDDASGKYGDEDSENDSDEEDRAPSSSKGGSSWQYNSLVSVSISPEKQVSSEGEATYKVIVKDLHDSAEKRLYNYEVKFSGSEQLSGTLGENSITLSAGEEKTIALSVKAERKGTYVFKVELFDGQSEDYTFNEVGSAKGLFIYGGEDEEQSPSAYFEGEGFAVNGEQGFLVDLNILNKDLALVNQDGTVITGKIYFRNEPHKIEGTLQDSAISFRIYSPNGKDQIGNFDGTIKKYEDFLLLQGDLILGSDALEVFELTAASKLKRIFSEIKPTETSSGEQEYTQSTSINEIIAIQKSERAISEVQSDKAEETTEFYVKPTEIKEKKYLWVIPSGKQILVVEVYDENGKVVEKNIEEFGSTEVEDYQISVGSLENENSIEISVEQTA